MWNMSNLLGAFQKLGVCGLVVNSITLERCGKQRTGYLSQSQRLKDRTSRTLFNLEEK